MFNQKGFSKTAVIIIAVVLIGAGYFVYNNSKKDKDASLSEQTNTSQSFVKTEEQQILTAEEMPEELTYEENLKLQGWKTYRNEKYGFEFMYPNEWLIAQESSTNNIFVRLSKDGENGFSLNIGPIIDMDGKKITLDEFLSFYNKHYKDMELKQGIKNINGIQMVYFDNSLVGLEKNKFVKYIAEREGLKYDFNLKYSDKNNVIYFEKIISTFKFTK